MPSPFPWITREKQVVQLSALPPSCSSRAQEKLFWKGQGVCLCAFPRVPPPACVQRVVYAYVLYASTCCTLLPPNIMEDLSSVTRLLCKIL